MINNIFQGEYAITLFVYYEIVYRTLSCLEYLGIAQFGLIIGMSTGLTGKSECLYFLRYTSRRKMFNLQLMNLRFFNVLKS